MAVYSKRRAIPSTVGIRSSTFRMPTGKPAVPRLKFTEESSLTTTPQRATTRGEADDTFVAPGYKSVETTYNGQQAWQVIPE